MFLRRLATLILSLVLLGLPASTALAPTVAAYSFCANAGAPAGVNQVFVRKNYAQSPVNYNNFTYVSGDATARDLEACVASGGGTYVLPANLENPEGQIVQVGYGKIAGLNQSLHFFYTPNPGGNVADGTPYIWPSDSSFHPTVGHRYRFLLTKYYSGNSTYGVEFRITDVGSGATSFVDIGTIWPIASTDAWWGYESMDDTSDLGHNLSNGYIDMAYMRYKFDGSSTLWTRDGWTLACCLETRGSLRTDLYWQGGNWDSSLPDDDMLDVWTNHY